MIMSSLAQEKRRSISENATWGENVTWRHRKQFADGKASPVFSHELSLKPLILPSDLF